MENKCKYCGKPYKAITLVTNIVFDPACNCLAETKKKENPDEDILGGFGVSEVLGGGLKPGTLHVVGGRTRTGKSSISKARYTKIKNKVYIGVCDKMYYVLLDTATIYSTNDDNKASEQAIDIFNRTNGTFYGGWGTLNVENVFPIPSGFNIKRGLKLVNFDLLFEVKEKCKN